MAYKLLETGKYQQADLNFQNADHLKKGFEINKMVFSEGIAYSMEIYLLPEEKIRTSSCTYSSLHKLPEKYITLFETLLKDNQSIPTLDSLMNLNPDLPLGNHYLGKKYYQIENWPKAIEYLKKAEEKHPSDDEMIQSITNEIGIENIDSCLLSRIILFQYNRLEDLNLLIDIYVTLDSSQQLISYYQKIIHKDSINTFLLEEYWSIGAIRLARYYVRTGQYSLAEDILLNAHKTNYDNSHINVV